MKKILFLIALLGLFSHISFAMGDFSFDLVFGEEFETSEKEEINKETFFKDFDSENEEEIKNSLKIPKKKKASKKVVDTWNSFDFGIYTSENYKRKEDKKITNEKNEINTTPREGDFSFDCVFGPSENSISLHNYLDEFYSEKKRSIDLDGEEEKLIGNFLDYLKNKLTDFVILEEKPIKELKLSVEIEFIKLNKKGSKACKSFLKSLKICFFKILDQFNK